MKLIGSHLITASFDRAIKLWEIESGRCLTTIHQENLIATLSVLSDDEFASSSHEKRLQIWSLANLSKPLLSREFACIISSICPIPKKRVAIDKYKQFGSINQKDTLETICELKGSY